jgi:hypothetical protein
MPVARAFREAQAGIPIPPGETGNKKTVGLVKNVTTRWNSSLALFR